MMSTLFMRLIYLLISKLCKNQDRSGVFIVFKVVYKPFHEKVLEEGCLRKLHGLSTPLRGHAGPRSQTFKSAGRNEMLFWSAAASNTSVTSARQQRRAEGHPQMGI